MNKVNSINSVNNQSVQTEKPKKSVKETVTKAVVDNKEIIIGSLIALAAIGAACIAIKKGKKPVEIKSVIPDVAPTTNRNVDDIIKIANEKLEGNPKLYGKIKAAATKNNTHADKKVIKQTLRATQDSNQVIEKVRLNKFKSNVKATKTSSNVISNAGRHIKNAGQEELSNMANNADNVAKNVRQNADSARQIADEIGTRKATKYARMVENRASQAEAGAKKTAAAVQEQAKKIDAENILKAPAREITASRTAEQLAKQEANGQKAAVSAVKRDVAKQATKPAAKRQSTLSIAEQRINGSFQKKFPNTDEGNIRLLDIMNEADTARRNVATAMLQGRKVI